MSNDLDALVADYTNTADSIAHLTEHLDQVKAKMRDLGEGKHSSTSGITVTVSAPPKRFDPKAAVRVLPEDVLQQCQDFSASKAKRVLAPALYESFCVAGGESRVSVR